MLCVYERSTCGIFALFAPAIPVTLLFIHIYFKLFGTFRTRLYENRRVNLLGILQPAIYRKFKIFRHIIEQFQSISGEGW